MRARRIAALWVPGLALQCAARDDASLREQAVAITDGTVVIARNRRAVEAGVAVGMRAAEAVTHAADLLLVPHDPQGVQEVWDAVLVHLDQLGPVVEDAGLGEALIDLSGVGGRERLIVRRTLTALASLLQLTARGAVADGPTVASIAAHRAARTNDVMTVPPGKNAAFLAGRPVTCLPLPPAMQQELALLGVRTVGGFANLRPSDVLRRFGAMGMAALALALGQDDRPLIPRPRERQETLVHPFEPPVEDLIPILFVIKALLDAHAAGLRRDGLIAHGLHLTLTFEGHDPLTIEQRWSVTTIPGHAELDALRLALDARMMRAITTAPPPRITMLTMTLLDCMPDMGTQLPLVGGATVLRRQAVARLLTRLHTLLGPESVIEATPAAAHLPEEGWTARPYDATRVGTPVPERPDLPLSLLLPPTPGFTRCHPPELITLTWHNERPVMMQFRETQQTVIAGLGPYTAEGRWWEAGRYMRAYWLLLTADQALHLVAEDRATGEWARYGVLD